MTFTEAAAEVLRIAGKPLHFKDITQLAIEKNLLSHVGKTPDVTMGARLSLAIKKEPEGPLVRVKPGVFALREWEQGGKKKKKAQAEKESTESADAASTAESDAATEADDAAADGIAALASEVDAAENAQRISEPVPSSEIARRDDEELVPLDEDEKMRGQLAAGATDLFEEEDDDDQPLFGGPEAAPGAAAAGEGGRRRRRRRRRGKGREGEQLGLGVPASGSPPSSFVPAIGRANVDDEEEETIGVTIGDERDEQPTRRAIVLERVPAAQHGRGGQQRPQEFRPPNFHRGGDRPNQQPAQSNFDLSSAPAFEGVEAIDDLVGRDLAEVVLSVLNAADRAQGPVPCRSIADAALRRGKLTGDPALAASSIAAACRADNLKRQAAGQRPRFRFAGGGRVAPTDWVLGPDLVRLEQEAFAAIERYRDASRRALASKLQKDMSGAALIELLLTVLERLGFRDIKPVRRAGLPGGESHFSGVHVTNGGDEIRTAIVLRRDGREIGRERVIDLRGSLHHYADATAGWLITTGQCLSGAREEASAPGTTPITLFDGIGLARLLEEGDVAVIKTKITLPFPDLELLETLRGI